MKTMIALCMAAFLAGCSICPPKKDQLILKVDSALLEQPQPLSKIIP